MGLILNPQVESHSPRPSLHQHLAGALFVLHSGSLMWYLAVINLLEWQCSMNVSCPQTHYGKGRNISNQFIQRDLGPHTVLLVLLLLLITAKYARCSELLHREAGPILGHSCIAVLALQGGIYNVCGMYNV